ncbi:DUF421 domain-containing protein [Paenibacillus sp. chi10]|uniref:DUF421 domain-containing protein n=1 Tax=Paenibacillus suaedae TaxID=3077233 RepID=A0AAJ2K2P9_9BACL|nr:MULTISPECIES: DUF421 domain-containing protein [unclassified Paenibacillus]MDT8978982.1 DUF421 domain-containing protein [Paenibacillus sp. chi10]GAV13564.1 hypothetical protein PBN151_3501 [Paenibacillus sp. NAIST15-1]
MDIIARTIFAFISLLAFSRLLGKKQMSHITLFNYITGITFGSIAADIAIETHISVVDGIISLTVWSLLTIGIGKLSLKFPRIRVLLDGEPTIVIKKGKILEKAMASMHLNMDDISMLLREKDVFSIQDVDYAILEPHGRMSVLKKAEKESPTKEDLKVCVQPTLYMPTEIIVDGSIVYKNLLDLNLTKEWLSQALRKAGCSPEQIEEIFYAEIQRDGTLYIDKRVDNMK